jgi:cell division septation protein DedD
VVIIAVFVAGYFMGRREGARTAAAERPPALPEVLSQYVPDKAEFTFYNTLTDKGEKTVSIDLKQKADKGVPEKKEAVPAEKKVAERTAAAHPEKGGPPPGTESSKAPEQTAKKEGPSRTEAPKNRYSVQVGSYEDKAMAEDEVRTMKQRGYAAFIVATDIPDKGRWYRVRLGSFSNKQAAEKLAKELQTKEGITSFITTE